MLCLTKTIQRSTCVICDTQSCSMLCETCKSVIQEDLFSLLLKRLMDEWENYDNLKTTCINSSDVVDLYAVPNQPTSMFDENLHVVDEQAKHLLDVYTDTSSSDALPLQVEDDGHSLFHTIQAFYPIMSIDEIYCRCLIELSTHQDYYDTIKIGEDLNLVGDERMLDHETRILNDSQYASAVTLAALANFIHRRIQSRYPKVNETDTCSNVLNTTFFPREQQDSDLQTPIRVLWSRPDNNFDDNWCANHFRPMMPLNKLDLPSATVTTTNTKNTIDDKLIAENRYRPLVQGWQGSAASKILKEKGKIIIHEKSQENNSPYVDRRPCRTFLEVPDVLKHVLNAVKEKSIVAEPPKQTISPSIFIVKFTEENRSSIEKDNKGVWIQNSSVNTHFIITKNNDYQILSGDSQGRWYYLKFIEKGLIEEYVDEKSIITLTRYIYCFLFILILKYIYLEYMPQTKTTLLFDE